MLIVFFIELLKGIVIYILCATLACRTFALKLNVLYQFVLCIVLDQVDLTVGVLRLKVVNATFIVYAITK